MSKHYLALHIRSSLAVKGLQLANGVGVIDLDYPKELGAIIHNPVKNVEVGIYHSVDKMADTVQAFCVGATEIKRGDKIGQLILMEHKNYLIDIHSEEERVSGFGSTGER